MDQRGTTRVLGRLFRHLLSPCHAFRERVRDCWHTLGRVSHDDITYIRSTHPRGAILGRTLKCRLDILVG